MFAASFVAFVLASLALASPTKRLGGLAVDVTGPSNAASVDDLKLTATVKNTGSEAVKILKYGTILDEKLPTRSFTVTKDGAAVAFTGIKLSVSLEDADDSAFAVIPAGESVTVDHNVASLFDFATAGAGTFKFEPVATFKVAGSEEKVASLADVEELEVIASAVEVTLSGTPENRELLSPLEKRARNTCTGTQGTFVSSAYSEAKQLATASTSYISSNSGSSLYTAYFKTNSPTTISSVFTGVANENSSSRILGCNDPLGACTSGVIAYTVISNTNIYFCSIFFNEVAQSNLCTGRTTVAARNVRGGTVLHEITHAVSGTDDVTYGCAADRSLSASQQRINADSYNVSAP
ncbi:Metalloprotease [Marasmius fiardii PR-910]|nr:Metalloprotease [Marasmius fiardii PR-910]